MLLLNFARRPLFLPLCLRNYSKSIFSLAANSVDTGSSNSVSVHFAESEKYLAFNVLTTHIHREREREWAQCTVAPTTDSLYLISIQENQNKIDRTHRQVWAVWANECECEREHSIRVLIYGAEWNSKNSHCMRSHFNEEILMLAASL